MLTSYISSMVAVIAFAHLVMAAVLIPSVAVAQATLDEPSTYYEDALVRFENEEYEEAVIQLKNALQENPNDLSARVLMGRTYLRLGDAPAAEEALAFALRAGADKDLILPLLGKAYLRQGKYLNIIDEISTDGRTPEAKGEILTLRGSVYLYQNQLDKAEKAFAKAARLRPDDVAPVLGQVKMLLRRGEHKTAEDRIDQATELAPEDVEVWLLKGEIRRLEGDLDGALANFDKVIQIEPDFVQARLGRAAVLISLERDKTALEDIEFVRSEDPDNPMAAYLYAMVLARANDTSGALSVLEGANAFISGLSSEIVANNAALLFLSGVINFAQGDFEIAQDALEGFVKLVPHHVAARKLLGAILIEKGDPANALKVLRLALKASPDDPQLLALLGNAYMKDQNHSEAMKMFQRAADLAPDRSGIRTELALSRLAIGQRETAIEELESAALAGGTGATRASVVLGLIYTNRGDHDAALRIAQALSDREPQNPAAYHLAGIAQLNSGDTAAARASIEHATQVDPRYIPAQLDLAQLDVYEGKTTNASVRYRAILGQAPNETRAMLGLVKIAEAENRLEDAIRWLEKVRRSNQQAVAERLYLIKLYQQVQKPELGREILQELKTFNQSSFPILLAVGQAELALGKTEDAVTTFLRSAAVADTAQQLVSVAKLQFNAEDVDGALQSLRKAIQLEPNFLPAQATSVEFKARQGEFDEALALTAKIRTDHPQAAVGDILTGDIMMQMKRFGEAVEAYVSAQQKQSSSALTLRLYQAYRQAGTGDLALQLLERWVAEHPEDLAARRTLAAGYIQAERLETARELHERLLEKQPDDPDLLNNLAWLYQETGDPRALTYAEKAYELAPERASILDTLGWILVQQGKPARSLQFLRQAQSRVSKNPDVRYHLGVALSRLGRNKEAQRELEQALKLDQHFPAADEARALLRQLAGG